MVYDRITGYSIRNNPERISPKFTRGLHVAVLKL